MRHQSCPTSALFLKKFNFIELLFFQFMADEDTSIIYKVSLFENNFFFWNKSFFSYQAFYILSWLFFIHRFICFIPVNLI